jgi:hypothetical protein
VKYVIFHSMRWYQFIFHIISGIFSSTLVYYRFSEEDWVSPGGGGEDVKIFCVRGAHSKIFWWGVEYFGNDFTCLHFGRSSRRHHGWGRAEKFWNFEVSRSSEMAFSDTFLVCMGMSVPLRDFVSQNSSETVFDSFLNKIV